MPDNELVQVPGRRLGRLPHDPDKPRLELSKYLTGKVPKHPASVDYFGRVTDWGMYGNDRFGTCGPTSVANMRKLTTLYLTDVEVSPTQDDVFDLYRRSGNPNFDPATGADDNGVNMQQMLGEVQHNGIGGEKCLAYAHVNVHRSEEVRAAISIFGGVLYGVSLDLAQQGQTGMWAWSPGSPPWGGHAVLGGLYVAPEHIHDYPDVSVISWAEVWEMSHLFEQHQTDEAWVVIWKEHMGSRAFQNGMSVDQLKADYKELTKRDFPRV